MAHSCSKALQITIIVAPENSIEVMFSGASEIKNFTTELYFDLNQTSYIVLASNNNNNMVFISL